MTNTEVTLCGLRLKNPIVPASGTFGFGLEMADAYDLNVLGGISMKGTTRDPRFGNECPRTAETPDGMINAVGLQNPGIEVLVSEKIPALRKVFGGVVIANISGFSVDEYAFCCEKAAGKADILEVNVSCPNVHGGGLAFGTDPRAAAEVTGAVKKVSGSTPVFVKLSPNVTDITAIAKACEDAGADGLTLINTVLGMRIDLKTRKPVIANRYGGWSGHAILPLALRMVHQVAHACSLPIMGCGGVSNAREALEMMMAGATAVQVGAENLRDPYCCKTMAEELPRLCGELRIEDINEIIGIA